MSHSDALVIGGSLAGSAAGVALARQGWNVAIVEKSVFPREKVCGEFLSPGAWPVLESLGVADKIMAAGGAPVYRASFSFGARKPVDVTLPEVSAARPFGMALSRFQLDSLLLGEAQAAGCEVFQNQEVTAIHRVNGSFEVTASDFAKGESVRHEASVLINAAGRSHRWRERRARRDPRVCFKAHFTGPSTAGSVRMFFFSGGYFGLVDVEDGTVNLCGIVSEEKARGARFQFDSLLSGAAEENDSFRNWLKDACRLTPWFTCGPQTHEFRGGYRQGIFYAGDAACSLEPLLGQGMTMALAGGVLIASSLGKPPGFSAIPAAAAGAYERRLRDLYRERLYLGRLLRTGWRKLMLFPSLARWAAERICAASRPDVCRNTWRAGDGRQWRRWTAPERAGIPP